MSSLVYRIHTLLSGVLAGVRVGTNLDLSLLIWTLLSGRLLQSRGGVIPALSLFGLPEDAVRRCWAALAYGRWDITDLTAAFEARVSAEGRWRPRSYGGYAPVAGDLTGFYRPCLRDCPTKHYCAEAGRSLPAIRVGLLARVGEVETVGTPAGKQRLALPVSWVRPDPDDPSERAHLLSLLGAARERIGEGEAGVFDRGFPLRDVLEAGPERFVVRLPKNFTARRASLPPYKGVGRRPAKGEIVRPLSRTYQDKPLPATPPDRTEEWAETMGEQTLSLRADVWDDLVLPDADPLDARTPRFRVAAVHDPRFAEPLLVATRLPARAVTAADLRGLYLDRWPVEGLPLAAKVVLGAHRQFVFAPESRQRLPELTLLSGAMLSYLAATQEAVPTGFWDRAPKPTAGRLRRVLSGVRFQDLGALPKELRKKDSPTAHLPKGVLAHRRQKRTNPEPSEAPSAA
jgi:hypothetical protein